MSIISWPWSILVALKYYFGFFEMASNKRYIPAHGFKYMQRVHGNIKPEEELCPFRNGLRARETK
jgi:hypothetical protein